MANCTSTGFSGTTGFSFSGQNAIPNGKICVLAGYVQSALTQTATMKDSNGNVVAQISASGGTTGTPASMGSKAFTANGGNYTLTFTNSGSQTAQVLSANDNIAIGATTYAASWVFITEDTPNGGDCDFNDSTVFVSWNLLQG